MLLAHSQERVYDVLADLSGHHRWIPLTRTDAPARPARPGDRLHAVTARFFVDRMVVTQVVPPPGPDGVAVLRLRKTGPVLLGSVRLEIRRLGPARCEALWREDVWLRGPLPRRLTAAVLSPFLTGMTQLALRRVDRFLRS